MARILLVESDNNVSGLFRLILEAEGYEVDSCTSGGKALEIVEEGKTNLVITANGLSGTMNGNELCEKIRERKLELITFMITGGNLPTNPMADLSWRKPTKPSNLLRTIAHLLKTVKK